MVEVSNFHPLPSQLGQKKRAAQMPETGPPGDGFACQVPRPVPQGLLVLPLLRRHDPIREAAVAVAGGRPGPLGVGSADWAVAQK